MSTKSQYTGRKSGRTACYDIQITLHTFRLKKDRWQFTDIMGSVFYWRYSRSGWFKLHWNVSQEHSVINKSSASVQVMDTLGIRDKSLPEAISTNWPNTCVNDLTCRLILIRIVHISDCGYIWSRTLYRNILFEWNDILINSWQHLVLAYILSKIKCYMVY